MRPKADDAIITGIFVLNILVRIHIMRAESKKPKIYPPVGPKRAPKPPLKPANTGRPIAPRITYVSIVKNPNFPPRTIHVINTAKVWRVNGTANGIDIHEHTVIRATNNAANAIERVELVILYSFLFNMISDYSNIYLYCQL